MCLDNSGISELSDSSKKNLSKLKATSMSSDFFVMKNRKARSNGKKVSEKLFETRNQKNKEKPQPFKEEIHHSSANVEDPEEQKANEGRARRLASELTPVEQRHDFATSTGALD